MAGSDVCWHNVCLAALGLAIVLLAAHWLVLGRSFVLARNRDLRLEKRMKTPNQALQHNDPSCHESCLRTPPASRGRG